MECSFPVATPMCKSLHLLVALLASVLVLSGQTLTFTPLPPTDWLQPSFEGQDGEGEPVMINTWSVVGVDPQPAEPPLPDSGSTAVITNARHAMITAGSALANIVRVGNNDNGGTLELTGGSLAVGSNLQVSTAGAGLGVVIVSGGSLQVSSRTQLASNNSAAAEARFHYRGGTVGLNALDVGTVGTAELVLDGAAARQFHVANLNLGGGTGGELRFVLGEFGYPKLKLSHALSVAANATLTIDGTAYRGGTASPVLIEAGNIDGDLAGAAVELLFPDGYVTSLRQEAGSLILDIDASGVVLPDPENPWQDVAASGDLKPSGTALGWILDKHFPWVYSMNLETWLFVDGFHGDAEGFHAFNLGRGHWLHLAPQYQDFIWNASLSQWQRSNYGDDPGGMEYWFAAVFPPREQWAADDSPLQIVSDFDPSGSAWWMDFPEEWVFRYALKKEPTATPHWQMRIGEGGQIYSLIAYGNEWIPPQYRSPEDPSGPDYAPWVDEVFQTVAVYRDKNRPEEGEAYFLHGAGIYLRDPPHTDRPPFYSPTVASARVPHQRELAMVNWSQHAHVPTIHRSGLLVFNQFIDRGNGIIELNWVLHNFGEDLLDFFNMPWGGVRRSNLPHHFLYHTDGSREELTGNWGDGNTIAISQTGGWASYAASEAPDAPVLGMVFGRQSMSVFEGRWSESRWRWGIAGNWPDAGTPEQNWRNYFVGATQVRVNLDPGQTMHQRFFMLIGEEGAVADLVGEHDLVSRAVGKKMDYPVAEAAPVKLVAVENNGIAVPQPDFRGSADAWFYLASVPVNGWRPVFLMRSSNGGYVISDDPYRVSHPDGTPDGDYWRPYNGLTESWKLLGFAPPVDAGFGLAGSWDEQPIAEFFAGHPGITVSMNRNLLLGAPAE